MNVHRHFSTTKQKIHAKRRRCRRKAAAAIECAFCLPIILVLTLGTIEATSAIFMKESLTIAAYEGARVGVQRKANNQHAVNQVQRVLDARGIKNARITVRPDDITALNALQVVTVRVSAPLRGNSFFIGRFFGGRRLAALVKMRREYDE